MTNSYCQTTTLNSSTSAKEAHLRRQELLLMQGLKGLLSSSPTTAQSSGAKLLRSLGYIRCSLTLSSSMNPTWFFRSITIRSTPSFGEDSSISILYLSGSPYLVLRTEGSSRTGTARIVSLPQAPSHVSPAGRGLKPTSTYTTRGSRGLVLLRQLGPLKASTHGQEKKTVF